MQFIGFLLCIIKDFYCANLNTRVGRIDRPSMNSGTTFDELRDHPSINSATAAAFSASSAVKKRPFDCFALRDHLRRTQGPALRIANYK
jgi:hypothetical protein